MILATSTTAMEDDPCEFEIRYRCYPMPNRPRQPRSIFPQAQHQQTNKKQRMESPRWKPAPSSSELASLTFPLLDSRNGMHSPYLDGANRFSQSFNSFFSPETSRLQVSPLSQIDLDRGTGDTTHFRNSPRTSGGFLGELVYTHDSVPNPNTLPHPPHSVFSSPSILHLLWDP